MLTLYSLVAASHLLSQESLCFACYSMVTRFTRCTGVYSATHVLITLENVLGHIRE